MSDPTPDDLRAQLRESQRRIHDLEAELERVREWRKSALVAVVIVALLAILMLGIVAFNAVDDSAALARLAGS